jgi:hypothetical protein
MGMEIADLLSNWGQLRTAMDNADSENADRLYDEIGDIEQRIAKAPSRSTSDFCKKLAFAITLSKEGCQEQVSEILQNMSAELHISPHLVLVKAA